MSATNQSRRNRFAVWADVYFTGVPLQITPYQAEGRGDAGYALFECSSKEHADEFAAATTFRRNPNPARRFVDRDRVPRYPTHYHGCEPIYGKTISTCTCKLGQP